MNQNDVNRTGYSGGRSGYQNNFKGTGQSGYNT